MLIYDLINTEPDSVIVVVEGKNVINEGLGLWMVLRSIEGLVQHLFHQLKVWLSIEG